MRILFFASVPGDPTAGGAPTALRRLGEGLRADGHEVDFLFAEDLPGWVGAGPLTTFTVPAAVPFLVRAAKGYDILDMTSGDGVLLFHLRRAGLLKTVRRVVIRSHGSEHQFAGVMREAERQQIVSISPAFRARFFGVRLWQVARSLELCDGIICCTTREADFLAGQLRIAREKFAVIPHGVAPEFLNPALRRSGKRKQIVFIGNWVWNKGIRFLGPVLRMLREVEPDVRLAIVCPHASPSDVWQELGNPPRESVALYSRLSQRQIAELLAESQLLLFPSDYEGFGLVALESLATGTPVVMTRNVGLAEFVRGREFARVAPADAETLAAECSRLFGCPELCARLGVEAREWARDFTWEQAARRTADFYRSVLNTALAHAS